MNKPLILVVEDDIAVARLIATTLDTQNYQYHRAQNGAGALLDAASCRPDVMLLDLGLPDMDGVEVIRKIREWSNMPIIVVSARTEDTDKVSALDAGADDYLTKPFGVMELLARVRAILRRSGEEKAEDVLTHGPIMLDRLRHRVTAEGAEVVLTHMEFELLAFLMAHPGQALTREVLLDDVWGMAYAGDTRTVDVHIRTLRQKLGSSGSLIATVRGVGYRLEDAHA